MPQTKFNDFSFGQIGVSFKSDSVFLKVAGNDTLGIITVMKPVWISLDGVTMKSIFLFQLSI